MTQTTIQQMTTIHFTFNSPVPYDVIMCPHPLLIAAEQLDGEYVLPSAIAQVLPEPFTRLEFCFWT